MKKLLALLFVCVSLNATSQSNLFTMPELIKLVDAPIESTKTAMAEKGWQLYSTIPADQNGMSHLVWVITLQNIQYGINLEIRNGTPSIMNYLSDQESVYNTCLQWLKNNYTFEKSEPENNGVKTVYKGDAAVVNVTKAPYNGAFLYTIKVFSVKDLRKFMNEKKGN